MRIAEKNDLILVIMEDGENLITNITKLKEKFESISFMSIITALGMLKNVKMGFWNGKEYIIHYHKDPAELLGISGIITPYTEPFFHFHVTIGTEEGKVMGGHLIESTVCNTLEMVLLKGDFNVIREEIGNLKLLRLKKEV